MKNTVLKSLLLVAGLLILVSSLSARAEGLYREQTYRAFVSDPKAFRIGDNLTVIVTEFASMTTSARTTTDKEGSSSAAVSNTNTTRQGSINLGENSVGGGRIERTGRLTAQLTVTVLKLHDNGDLQVRGEQEIEVNNEKQKLVVEGRIRREDIRTDNTVLSSRLSEAKISYTGQGLLAEKQKPGIVSRFLSWLGLL